MRNEYRVYGIVLILILLTLPVFAKEHYDARESAYIEANVVTSCEITTDANNESDTYVTIAYSIPFNDTRQKILYINSTDEYVPSMGTFSFKRDKPENGTITHRSVVWVSRTAFVEPIIATKRGAPDAKAEKDRLSAWTGDIKRMAENITFGAENDLVAIARMGLWVHKNVEYDLNYSDIEMPADFVFKNRVGTCDEYTRLFIAMLDSIGIEARPIKGFAYNGEKWDRHMWTEVHLDGQWIEVDPTYDEIGFVDATHISFPDLSSKVTVRGGSIIENIFNQEVVLVRRDNASPMLELKADAPYTLFGSDTPVNINVEIKNLAEDSYVIGVAEIITPDRLKIAEGEDKKVFFIIPGGKTTVNFTVITPVEISPEYIYTYPIIINTFPPARKDMEIKMMPEGINTGIDYGGIMIDRIDASLVSPNETETSVVVKNNAKTRQTGNVVLCMDDNCIEKKIELLPLEETIVNVMFPRLSEGTHRIKSIVYNEKNTVQHQNNYNIYVKGDKYTMTHINGKAGLNADVSGILAGILLTLAVVFAVIFVLSLFFSRKKEVYIIADDSIGKVKYLKNSKKIGHVLLVDRIYKRNIESKENREILDSLIEKKYISIGHEDRSYIGIAKELSAKYKLNEDDAETIALAKQVGGIVVTSDEKLANVAGEEKLRVYKPEG